MDGGVAVFFVLSGFLIYRPFALARQLRLPPPRLRLFWWRWLLRIVPAYWFALSFLWALGALDLGESWWRYFLLLQPYSSTTALGGLVQSWSLAPSSPSTSSFPFGPRHAGFALEMKARNLLTVGLGLGAVAASLSWSLLEKPTQRFRIGPRTP